MTLKRAIHVRLLAADVDLLRRVIEYLLDNAIRHAPQGTEVRVTAVTYQRHPSVSRSYCSGTRTCFIA